MKYHRVITVEDVENMTLKGEKAVSAREIYKEPEQKYYYAICIYLFKYI